MAPFPIRKMVCNTGKKCLKVIKKLANPRGRTETRSPDPCSPPTDLTVQRPAATQNLSAVTSCMEDCKSNVTSVTWLDDVRDLEDMENRLNEALEMKMMKMV